MGLSRCSKRDAFGRTAVSAPFGVITRQRRDASASLRPAALALPAAINGNALAAGRSGKSAHVSPEPDSVP